jgi:hypothetical protein
LHAAYRRSFPWLRVVDRSQYESQAEVKGYAAQAPIADIGRILGLDREEIARTRRPYLFADKQRVAALRTPLSFGPSAGLCGISWRSGNRQIGTDKSIGLGELMGPLMESGYQFVNLQYGEVGEELGRVRRELGVEVRGVEGLDVFNDIEGLLALIEVCDVVVTTSNVTAHLAGAMGKKAAVMVPYGKGRLWYWHEGDSWSLWYPSLRVFYQGEDRRWDRTVQEVAQWLNC